MESAYLNTTIRIDHGGVEGKVGWRGGRIHNLLACFISRLKEVPSATGQTDFLLACRRTSADVAKFGEQYLGWCDDDWSDEKHHSELENLLRVYALSDVTPLFELADARPFAW